MDGYLSQIDRVVLSLFNECLKEAPPRPDFIENYHRHEGQHREPDSSGSPVGEPASAWEPGKIRSDTSDMTIEIERLKLENHPTTGIATARPLSWRGP